MKKTFFKTAALAMVLTFSVSSMGFAAGGSIGHGDISVYKNGNLTTKLTGQNPIEDNALLVCDGRCMIKSEGISLIGSDGVQIAVDNETDTFKLYVKEGKVDYIINSNVRKISFYTPQGTYTVAEVVFNASSSSVVKGSVVVGSDGETEISVTEGRMIFATAEGMKVVDANNKIVLAVVPGAAPATGVGWGVGAAIAAGFVAAGALVGAGIDNSSDGNGGVFVPPSVSPFN